jgi:hypothetical protein
MEDWVERLHQTGMCLQERFRRVKNQVVCAQAYEKAHSRSSHPDVIAHTDATNAGNKRSFSVEKINDTITMQQKRQRNLGRHEVMINFEKEAKINKLKWSVLIFDDGKVDLYKSANGG